MPNAVVGRSLFLSLNSDAIDVSPSTKRDAVAQILADYALDAAQAAAIGDSPNDLPFLTYPNLALVAAPANAQARVREVVASLAGGAALSAEAPQAFLDFYAECARKNVQLLVADRDGVIRARVPQASAAEIFELYAHMGDPGKPFVAILTGSSVEQNLAFIAEYRLDEALARNAAATSRWHIYAENGALRMNAVTKRCEMTTHFDPDVIRLITHEITDEVLRDVQAQVLPSYGFTLSTEPSPNPGTVYVPKKRTMLTVNVPRTGLDGAFFRDTPQAERFRHDVASVMRASLERHHITPVQL